MPLRPLIAPLLLLAAMPATAQQAADLPIRVDGYADIAHLDLQGCIANASQTYCTTTDGVTYTFPFRIAESTTVVTPGITITHWSTPGPVIPAD